MLSVEWDAVDFTFFSIATGVLRFNSLPPHNYRRREECLQYARKALFAMQACQRHISTSPYATTTDFLFWYYHFIRPAIIQYSDPPVGLCCYTL